MQRGSRQQPEPPMPVPASSTPGTRRSAGSLPPRVRGNVRGSVRVCVDEVVWFPAAANSANGGGPVAARRLDAGTTLVRLKWWGEQGEGTVWRPEVVTMDTDGHVQPRPTPTPPTDSRPKSHQLTATQEFEATERPNTHTVEFPIVVSPGAFTKYLHDAQWLVFEIYHFLESDPAAMHRDFIKQLQRAAHPNRAHPQVKPPIGHIMFDLAPLSEALSFGDAQWAGSKNLPILVNGIPIGQVSVRLISSLTAANPPQSQPQSSQLQSQVAEAPRPERGSFATSHEQALPNPMAQSQAGSWSQQQAPHSSLEPSPTISFGSGSTPYSGGAHSSKDQFDIAHFISQSEDMSKAIHESIHGPPVDVQTYINQQQERQKQQQPQPQSSSPAASAFTHSPAGEEKYSSPPPPAQSGRPGQHFASFAHAAPSRPSSVGPFGSRAFSAPPPFADYTPAPAHFFPHNLPQLPAVLDFVPPFPEPSPTSDQDANSFIDQGGLLTIWMRVRRVTLFKSRHEVDARLGGRGSVQPSHIAGVDDLIASKRREADNANDGTYMVLHYQLFNDVRMGRTPALLAPLRGEARPACFHYADRAPRVHARTLLRQLSTGTVPIEVYSYQRKPSWKDPLNRETLKFTPQAPSQVILARASLPLSVLLKLPTSSQAAPSHSWMRQFLQSRTALNTVMPVYDPHNPSPLQVGEMEVALGWGSANDVALLDRLEASTIVAQKVVRGFLVRRRIRRTMIAHQQEELRREELEEEEALAASQVPVPMSAPTPQAAPAPISSPLSSRSYMSSLASSPRTFSGSPRSPRYQPSQRESSHVDMATSPLPPSRLKFHLNLPVTGSPTTPRRAHPQPPAPQFGVPLLGLTAPPPLQHPAPVSPEFVAAPRAEDRKDFVSYSYNRHKPVVASAPSIRSYEDVLAQIQASREAAAKVLEPKPTPPTPSTPSKLLRVTSPPASILRASPAGVTFARGLKQEESKQLTESIARVDQADQKTPLSSPPRVHRTPVRGTPGSARRQRQKAPVDEDLDGEYSDVSIDEYSDDEHWPAINSIPPPSAAAPTYTPAAMLFLPSTSYDGLDASVARRRLQQQIGELDELQRRMNWKLSGRPMEEFATEEKAHAIAPKPRVDTYRPQLHQQPMTPLSPEPFLSATPVSKSAPPPSFFSPGVQSHQASPVAPVSAKAGSASPVTPPRQAAIPAPHTPSTSPHFLSPSPVAIPSDYRRSDPLAASTPVQSLPSPATRSPLPAVASPAVRSPLQHPVPTFAARTSTPSTPAAAPHVSHASPSVARVSPTAARVAQSALESTPVLAFDDVDVDVGMSDADDDSDVSVDSDSENDDVDHGRWGLRVSANNLDVQVQYTADAGSAEDRARLFPHGLRGAPEPDQPGSRTHAHLTASAPPGSSGPQRWDGNYTPSDDEAKRMQRIARIMAE